MAKIRILTTEINAADDEALEKLLREAGCEVDVERSEEEGNPEEEIADSDGEGGPTEEDDICVIVLTPGCERDTEFNKVVETAAAGGCRVLGIWSPRTKEGVVPRVFEDYGSDTVTWDPRRLRDAINRDTPTWETPNGEPRPQPVTKRNKC